MVGKRVQFDDETWVVVNLLRQERRRSFQQLADEAFADLLVKHRHPIDVKSQLRASLGKRNLEAAAAPREAGSSRLILEEMEAMGRGELVSSVCILVRNFSSRCGNTDATSFANLM